MREGIITNVLNPKVAIFFISFLPQFVDAHSETLNTQILFLGLWFTVQGTLILMGVSYLTGKGRNLLRKNKRFWAWKNRLTGMMLAGLGLSILFQDHSGTE